MVKKLSFLSLRLILRKPKHSLALVVGIALGVALIYSSLSIGRSNDASFEESISTLLGKAEFVISNSEPFPAKLAKDAIKGSSVKQSVPQLNYLIRIKKGESYKSSQAIGIKENEARKIFSIKTLKGKFDLSSDKVVIPKSLATEIDVDVGDKINLQTGAGIWQKNVSAILADTGLGSQSGVYIDLQKLQKNLELENKITSLFVDLKQGARNYDIERKRIEKKLVLGMKVDKTPVVSAYALQMSKMINYMMLAVGLFAIIIGTALIYFIATTSSIDRFEMIALLRSYGATGRQLKTIFVIESIIIGVLASATGILIGSFLIYILSLTFFYLIHTPASIFYLDLIIFAFLLGVVVSLVATIVPIIKMSKISVARGLRSKHQTVYKTTKETLLTKSIIVIAKPLTKIMPSSIIAKKNIAYNYKRFRLIVFILSLSIAMLVGIQIATSAMVASTSDFFKSWDKPAFFMRFQELPGLGLNARIPFSKTKEIKKIKGVKSATALYFGVIKYKGKLIQLRALGADDFIIEEGIEKAREKFASGGYVAVSNTFAEKKGIKNNDILELEVNGKKKKFKVAAIIFEIRDSLSILYDDALRIFDINQADELMITAKKNTPFNVLHKRLEKYASGQGYVVLTNKEAKEQITGLLQTLINFLRMLVGSVFAMITLSIANVVLVGALSKTRLYGIIRAQGMKRYQLTRLLALESILIGLLSLPFGALLGLVLGRVAVMFFQNMGMNISSFNWVSFPITFVIVLATLFVVTFFSCRKIAKVPISIALQYE